MNRSSRTLDERVDCLLLNPPAPFTRCAYLGIAQLTAVLRERGIHVAILDSLASGCSLKATIGRIRRLRPRIVGITIVSPTLRSSYLLIQAFRRDYPEGLVVVGGTHIDSAPEKLATWGVRYGFWAECEYESADFVEQVLGGRVPEGMAGLLINDNGQISKGEAQIVQHLDALPMPAYDLLPIGRYYSPNTRLGTISFIASRGRPHKCIFCSKSHFDIGAQNAS
jgi:radical SAM superfamily enzyme YgiQ (UPF0313 family)